MRPLGLEPGLIGLAGVAWYPGAGSMAKGPWIRGGFNQGRFKLALEWYLVLIYHRI